MASNLLWNKKKGGVEVEGGLLARLSMGHRKLNLYHTSPVPQSVLSIQ